jgi:hypothetical protein
MKNFDLTLTFQCGLFIYENKVENCILKKLTSNSMLLLL